MSSREPPLRTQRPSLRRLFRLSAWRVVDPKSPGPRPLFSFRFLYSFFCLICFCCFCRCCRCCSCCCCAHCRGRSCRYLPRTASPGGGHHIAAATYRRTPRSRPAVPVLFLARQFMHRTRTDMEKRALGFHAGRSPRPPVPARCGHRKVLVEDKPGNVAHRKACRIDRLSTPCCGVCTHMFFYCLHNHCFTATSCEGGGGTTDCFS